MPQDQRLFVTNKLRRGYSPISIVFQRFRPRVLKRLLYFIAGVILSFLVSPILFFNGIGVVQSYWTVWVIAWTASLLGLSLFYVQFLLLYDDAHHSVFPYSTRTHIWRIALIPVGVILAVQPLLILVPETPVPLYEHQTLDDLNYASWAVFAFLTPYIGKLAWDYYPIESLNLLKFTFLFSLTATLLVLFFLGSTTYFGFIDFTLLKIGKYSIYSGLTVGMVVLPVAREMETRTVQDYVNRTGQDTLFERQFEQLRISNRLPLLSGLFFGIGVPIAAGSQRAFNVGIQPGGSIDMVVFLLGYPIAGAAILMEVLTLGVLGIVAIGIFAIVTRAIPDTD